MTRAIWNKLRTVDQCHFSGRTPDRLNQLERHTGIPWEKIIEHLAKEGYAWNDAADLIGVSRSTLVQYTRTCGFSFPWQGVSAPIWREHHSRMMQGKNRICMRPTRQYTAFGVTDSLPNLVRRFSPDNLEYNCVHLRMCRNWNLEKALLTPPKLRSQNTVPRNPNAAANWNQTL